ncbi:DnaJ-domain-containing protein [Laetiporus sulphureus 93-53]|uniref:DnaJ-domain-containing protein n=1 Tax=Laetiporus sulphureus 93-53 TaxID=1314785 RepID=A0A165H7T8_9APHY|nr:DnaJ-domain-containing protein [Laetiporus sulphureus 93-53]KZT11363.1 DnaJ-domain-containing protein [Laetiporus sulphureus 93-53]
MDDRPDPISHFFPDAESVDLYEVLAVPHDAKPEDIKKSYRRLALAHHPDKHATASDSQKEELSLKFQQIGFAYAVLSDEKKRSRYDRMGRTDEGFELSPEDGWEAYFEDLFDRVTKEKLDELKKEYQGSVEEVADIKKAYSENQGSIAEIMKHIPHSTYDDEARFIVIISGLIHKGELSSLPLWESSVKDEKAKLVRTKQGQKEAKEAEELAKELGVWDEFYGNAKPSTRKSRGKAKASKEQEEEEADEDDGEDHSALQAIIVKRKNNMDGFFDSLAAKYAKPQAKGKKGKRRIQEQDDEDDVQASPKKKLKKGGVQLPEIDDEEFAKLQQTLFGDKAKSSADAGSTKAAKTRSSSKKSRR